MEESKWVKYIAQNKFIPTIGIYKLYLEYISKCIMKEFVITSQQKVLHLKVQGSNTSKENFENIFQGLRSLSKECRTKLRVHDQGDFFFASNTQPRKQCVSENLRCNGLGEEVITFTNHYRKTNKQTKKLNVDRNNFIINNTRKCVSNQSPQNFEMLVSTENLQKLIDTVPPSLSAVPSSDESSETPEAIS